MVVVFASTFDAARAAEPSLPPQPDIRPAGIPENARMLSPCIATMGEHWADPKTLPTGPFYGVWQGRPVFSEVMVSVSQLESGFAYDNLRALPGFAIDHVDIEFEPHGHPGLTVPHYDIHAYYVSPAEQAKICPTGVHDDAMKPATPKT